MTDVPVKQRMTADEFLAQPLGEGPRWQELVEGEVVVNEPTALHNVVQKDLIVSLDTWVRAGERRGLAIEIRSPSIWRYDVGAKKASYERHGLPELWLVDTPAEELLVFRRTRPDAETFDLALELGTRDALGSPLLPGFALALGELFRRREDPGWSRPGVEALTGARTPVKAPPSSAPPGP